MTPSMNRAHPLREPRSGDTQRGFTLIELIMVIVLLGVVAGMVAVFMKSPIDAYFDSARRAGLTDVADTVVRRLARDVRKALPNSIRSAGSQCVEFIPTKNGGRYRADVGGSGDVLDFTQADASFAMLGRNADLPLDQRIAADDLIAVYNLGIPGADAYAAENTAVVTSAGTELGTPPETIVAINARQFPLESPSRRFHVVPGTEQVVRYVCVAATGSNAQGDGNGTLYRQVLTLPLTLSASCPATVSGAAVMATRVSACQFSYSGSDLQRNALLSISLAVTQGGETVRLVHDGHVNNMP